MVDINKYNYKGVTLTEQLELRDKLGIEKALETERQKRHEEAHVLAAKGIPITGGEFIEPDRITITAGGAIQGDAVNHPKHYTQHPSGVECITITEHFNFNIGNAIKYLWRAGLKGDLLQQDLEKAVWYIKRELERVRDSNYKGLY